MCGLKSKLISPEFHEVINSYDIIFCTETKLDDLDILNLPLGYNYHLKNRKKYKRKSGGLAIIYKEILQPILKFHKTNSEYVQWVSTIDIIFWCVYIPPENSKYSSEDAFNS